VEPTEDTKSMIRCIGGGGGAVSSIDASMRSCVLSNVCFDGEKWWVYHWSETFTKKLLGTKSLQVGNGNAGWGKKGGWGYDSTLHDTISFHHRRSPFPTSFSFINGVTIFIRNSFSPDNVGHVLVDMLTARWHSFQSLFPEDNIASFHVSALHPMLLTKKDAIISDIIFDADLLLNNNTCFENLVVGSQRLSGLHGDLPASAYVLMRNRIYHQLEIQKEDPKAFKILILQKTKSDWNHRNFVRNWDEVKQWLSEYDVTVIDPASLSFREQIKLLSQTPLVVSLWGGISMGNFLMQSGSVEMLITTWDSKRYTKEMRPETECPDFERSFHNSYSHVTTVGYCSVALDDKTGWKSLSLDRDKFMETFSFAKSIVFQNFPNIDAR